MPPRSPEPNADDTERPKGAVGSDARWQTVDVIALDENGNPKREPGFVEPPSPERWAAMQEEWRAMSYYVDTGDPQPAIELGVLPADTPKRQPG